MDAYRNSATVGFLPATRLAGLLFRCKSILCDEWRVKGLSGQVRHTCGGQDPGIGAEKVKNQDISVDVRSQKPDVRCQIFLFSVLCFLCAHWFECVTRTGPRDFSVHFLLVSAKVINTESGDLKRPGGAALAIGQRAESCCMTRAGCLQWANMETVDAMTNVSDVGRDSCVS